MSPDEFYGPLDNLARAVIIIQDVKPVMTGGVVAQVEARILGQRFLYEAVHAAVQDGIVQSCPRYQDRSNLSVGWVSRFLGR
jgi:hypothetical protein